MIVDELFGNLAGIVDLNTTYYWVPVVGRLDIWTSWETCFVILLSSYEALFIWSFYNAVKNGSAGRRPPTSKNVGFQLPRPCLPFSCEDMVLVEAPLINH